MSDTELTIDAQTYKRVEAAKERLDAEQPDCPDHTMSGFLDYLLDTEQAVRDGYYD